jgi:hypothetical protein
MPLLAKDPAMPLALPLTIPTKQARGKAAAAAETAQLHMMLRRVEATAAGPTLGPAMAVIDASWMRPGCVMHSTAGEGSSWWWAGRMVLLVLGTVVWCMACMHVYRAWPGVTTLSGACGWCASVCAAR